jgi:hypothetical protein
MNYPVAALIQSLAVKKVRNPQFFASVRYGVGLGVYFVYLLLWTALAAIVLRWFALVVPVLLPLSGYLFLNWFESFKLWREAARVKSLHHNERDRLLKMRQDLLQELGMSSSS